MTGIITAEDYDEKCYIINITIAQQQSRNLELARKLNFNNRQDHGMIDIEELIND